MERINILIYIPEGHQDAKEFSDAIAAAFPGHACRMVQTREACLASIEGADVLIGYFDEIGDDVIRRAGRLKMMHSLITGMDWKLGLPSLGEEVLISRTRIYGPPMAEMALLYMLALSRRFPAMLRNQDAHKWVRLEGLLLEGKTVGILGIGAIGETLARKAKALSMNVIGISETARDIPEIDRFAKRSELLEIVPELDFLVVVVPLSAETRKIVSDQVIAAMKPSAFFVNIARGGVVDEDALLKALQNQTIAGAALDVFAVEPLPEEHPFWSMQNVIVTAHCAASSDSNTTNKVDVTVHNIRCLIEGRTGEIIDRVR